MEITEAFKRDLKRVVWDYEIDETELVAIFFGKAGTGAFSLNRDKLCARLLLSTPGYRLLDHRGVKGLKEILTDETIRQIWIKDLRERFIYARIALQGIS